MKVKELISITDATIMIHDNEGAELEHACSYWLIFNSKLLDKNIEYIEAIESVIHVTLEK